MPIVIAQPSPVGVAGEVGRLQGRVAGAAAGAQNVQAQLAAAQLYSQHAARLAAIQQQGAGQWTGADIAGAQLEQRAFETQMGFEDSRQRAVERQQAIHSQFQGQLMLQNEELTQKERMRLQQLKNAAAEVANDPNLSPREKQDLMLQLKTGIDPLERRNAAATVRMKELQQKELMEQMAQAESTRHLNEQFAAGNVGQLPLIQDPVTGQSFRMMRNARGEWYDPFASSRPKPEKPQVDFVDLRKGAWDKAVKAAGPEASDEVIRDKFQTYLREDEEYYRAHGLLPGGPAGGGGGGSQPPPVDPANQAELAKAEIADNPAIPAEMKVAAQNAIDDARKLLEGVGWDVNKLQGADRERYDRLKNFVRSLPKAPQQQQQQQQPAAPAPAPPAPALGPFDVGPAIQGANPFTRGPLGRIFGG